MLVQSEMYGDLYFLVHKIESYMLLGLSGCWLSATSNPVCLSSILGFRLPGCLVALKSFYLGINLMPGYFAARLPYCLV